MTQARIPYKVFTTAHDAVVDGAAIAGERLPPGESSFLRTEAEAAEAAGDLATDGRPVAVLVDMSGSNRGEIHRVIAYVDLVARALERAGTPFEVLGFTTASWKGGQSAQDWKAAGRPVHPGRVSDLLHVVFKDRAARWLDAGPSGDSPAAVFDRAYRAGNLRENIDGEAVRWALSRLPDGEEAEILLVSDGRPCEDVTMSYNPDRFLEDDLDRAADEAAERGARLTVLDIRDDARLWGSERLADATVKSEGLRGPVAVVRVALERLSAPRPGTGPTP